MDDSRDILAWWRERPLSKADERLITALFLAHDASTRRANLSRDAVVMSAIGTGDLTKALIAALSMLGGLHGPVIEIMRWLNEPLDRLSSMVDAQIQRGGRVPGWGNAFVKGKSDPIWNDVRTRLDLDYPKIDEKIREITWHLHHNGKKIYPNPGCYTAACAIALEMPPECAIWLLVQGRLAAWSETFYETVKQHHHIIERPI